MLKLCGFSKPQAEQLILGCLNHTIAAAVPGTSHWVDAVRISDIRLITQRGVEQQEKLYQKPVEIPWENGLIELCFDGADTAEALLDHLRSRSSQLTLTLGDNPVLTADIALRRKYNRTELEALQAKEMQQLDVLALQSVTKSQPPKQLHRIQARIEFTFKKNLRGGGCLRQPSRGL